MTSEPVRIDAPIGELVSQFRAAVARHPDDPAWTRLLERLRHGSPEFDRLWRDGGSFHPGIAPQRFLHPVAGPLRLAPYHLWSEPDPDGLPGAHHFYITFKTEAPGVSGPPDLLGKYPDEMTIVLQHQYWDLAPGETFFSVTLQFGGLPKRLSVQLAKSSPAGRRRPRLRRTTSRAAPASIAGGALRSRFPRPSG